MTVGLMAYFDDQYKRYEPMVGKVFEMMDSSKQREEFSGSTGISKLLEVGENGTYGYEDDLEDFRTILTHRTFKRGIQVSEEALDDDQYRTPQSRVRALARAASRTDDFNTFSVKRNGFTSTAQSYGDNEEHYSTSHDRVDGGTVRSNASSTGIVLAETALETASIAMDEALDHKGEVMGNMGRGNILEVPIALRKLSLEILGSPLRSGATTNDLNYYQLGDWDVFVNPWIGAVAGGSDTQWQVVRQDNTSLKFITRKPLTTKIVVDEETDATKFQARKRFSYGWIDPVGETWGSRGDLAAYSS